VIFSTDAGAIFTTRAISMTTNAMILLLVSDSVDHVLIKETPEYGDNEDFV
jgi:hypothetical protein